MSAKDSISIYWFRQDLRLSDNPALSAAIESGKVLPRVSGRKSVRNPDSKDATEKITKTKSRLTLPTSLPIIGAKTAPTLAIEEQVPIPVFL